MTLDRRSLLKSAGSAALLQGLLTVAGTTQPAFAAGPTVSSLRSNAKSWLWGAEDYALGTNIFTGKAGLTVEMAATNRGVNQDALLGNAADILLGAPTQNMRIQIRNQPVKMICGWVNKFASNIVIRKDIADKLGVSEASSVEARAGALKGLTLGTTGPAGGPDQLTRYFLRMAKLDPEKDAQLVPLNGGSPMLAAFQQKRIDGFCLSSPTSDVAVEKFGATYLFNMVTNPPPALQDYLYITASCTEKTMKEKPAELVAYCKGIALALRAIDADPAAFKAWSRSWFNDTDDALFEVAYKNNVGMYMKTPVPTKAQFELNAEFLDNELKQAGQTGVPSSFKFENAFDLSFVDKAMASL